jgi:hypothetical protein
MPNTAHTTVAFPSPDPRHGRLDGEEALARIHRFLEDQRMRAGDKPGSFADFERGLHAKIMELERELLAEEMARADVDAGAVWEEERLQFEKALRAGDVIPQHAATLAVSLDGVRAPMKDGEAHDKRQKFAQSRALTPEQAAVLRAIARCRTAELGGHLDVCVDCGHERPSYNSCHNRHCPKCQSIEQAKWIAEREARILPTAHFHVVFTIPSELHTLARFRREEVFDLLFKATARTLLDLGRQRLEAELGATMVLHTWTRDLRFHPHVHAIVTGGGLSLDATRWIPTRPDYFMPVKQLGAVFRDHFIEGLCALWRKGVFDGFEVPGGIERLLGLVAKKSWVVYAKRPFGEARHVL